jgi:hypothetical protein
MICNDDRSGDPASGSRFEHRRLEPGLYILRVAGRRSDQAGPFALHYSVLPAVGEANCDNEIDATAGGLFIGWLTEPGDTVETADRGTCVSTLTGMGDQERFVVRPAGTINLLVNSAGTQFEHAMYLRSGGCEAILVDDLCVQGAAGTGEVLFWEGWTGDAHITLDWVPPLSGGGNPDLPYQLLFL